MVNIHFIDNPVVLDVIGTIMALAGPNYNAPYDVGGQPSSGANRNADDFLQYQLPGGASLQGYAEPSTSKSMGSAINSLMACVAPFISAYMLILPILGVIRGIIEVLCALMNPFAVIRAIIKLFAKWIPAFVSLFPPLAGVVILLSTIKVILAIIFFILTVVVPVIQLIIANIKGIKEAFSKDGNKAQRDAIRTKLLMILVELMNQLGILSVLQPILDLIFLILGKKGGKPCKKRKKRGGDDEDSTCCDDDTCPPVLKDPPKGKALMLPAMFGEAPPLFAWRLYPLSGHLRLPEIVPYMQSMRDQLNPQLDEPIDEATTAAQSGNSAHFNIKITGKRGGGQELLVPMAKLNGYTMTAIDPGLLMAMGIVNYEIVPNWEILIGRNIVGLGCHPDVEDIKEFMNNKFAEVEFPATENHPNLAGIQGQHANVVNTLRGLLGTLMNAVLPIVFDPPITLTPDTPPLSPLQVYPPFPGVPQAGPLPWPRVDGAPPGLFYPPLNISPTPYPASELTRAIAQIPNTLPKEPEYDLAPFDVIQNAMISLLLDYSTSLKDNMNLTLAKIADPISTDFDVDKTLARADNTDKAIISVTPKDITGSLLSKSMPSGVGVDVTLSTDFGTIANQTTDSSTGIVTAEITSPFPGTATIHAKISTKYISEELNNTTQIKTRKVKFVADAILPKRRFVSKTHPGVAAQPTIGTGSK